MAKHVPGVWTMSSPDVCTLLSPGVCIALLPSVLRCYPVLACSQRLHHSAECVRVREQVKHMILQSMRSYLICAANGLLLMPTHTSPRGLLKTVSGRECCQ